MSDDNNCPISLADCRQSPCIKFDCDSCEHYCISLKGFLPLYNDKASGLLTVTGYDCYGSKIFCSDSIFWPGNPHAWGKILPHGRYRIYAELDDHISRFWKGYSDVVLDRFGMHPSNEIYLQIYFYKSEKDDNF